jgi:hypothetical protein
MRLDATTAEVVSFLLEAGFNVYGPPIDAAVTDESARVALKGGQYAVVYRDEFAKLQAAVETRPPAREHLTYHDLLTAYTQLDRRHDALRELWGDTVGKPALREKAREYSDQLNNLRPILDKIGRILHNQRQAAREIENREHQTAGA